MIKINTMTKPNLPVTMTNPLCTTKALLHQTNSSTSYLPTSAKSAVNNNSKNKNKNCFM